MLQLVTSLRAVLVLVLGMIGSERAVAEIIQCLRDLVPL